MKKLLLLQWLVVAVLFISISLPLITADDHETPDDSADTLLQNINSFRHAKNLSLLTENENAECFAEQIAEQFSNQICTNATGEDTVPGTEPQFQNFPQLLANCHLNISGTRDGVVLPNCVIGGNPDVAFENYTNGQYLQYLNDSKYVSAGVASENSWFVVVLATNTMNGNYQTDTSSTVHLKNMLLPFLPIMWILLLAI